MQWFDIASLTDEIPTVIIQLKLPSREWLKLLRRERFNLDCEQAGAMFMGM